MKRIAIPVENGQLSAHFGHSQMFFFYDTEGTDVKSESMQVPPPHTPGSIPTWIAEQKATDLIVGGVGQKAINILNERGVNVHVGAPVQKPRELVDAFLAGKLQTNANMCDH